MRVVLHGGFHKTATSHLQGILQRNSGHLTKRGVMYIHHRLVRRDFTVPCQRNANLNSGLNTRVKIPDDKLREIATAFFAPVREANPETLIISDENLYGHCGQVARKGALYHFRERFVRTFAREMQYEVTDIYLSIRNYPDFFAAAYCEYLRSAKPERFVDISTMMKNVVKNQPRWTKLLKFAARQFPNAEIHVWKFEDFREISPQVLQSMCGENIKVQKLKNPKQKNKRPSPSDKAMNDFIEVKSLHGPERALQVRLELENKYPKGETYKGFQPWSQADRQQLINLYDEHWDEICNMSRFNTLHPNQ
ncbi:MAG: hypothetical protein V3V13_09500 [Paracoccaceae bacterium]